jgi:endogenous inhibitor of DNA gyrase (YacG/DUF329 family)
LATEGRSKVSVTGVACPECGKRFDKPQGLAVHRSRSHGVRGKGGGKKPVALVKVKADTSTQQPATPPRVAINYCPCCGTNVALVAQALAIAEGIGRGPG